MVLDPSAREYLFMIIHNIVPNRERLYLKMNMVNNPCCVECNVREDNVHIFSECSMVQEAWFWVRSRLLAMLPEACSRTSNFEFLNRMFARDILDSEAIWIIGNFVQLVWDIVICKKKSLKIETMKNEFEMKYFTHHKSNMPHLGYIVGLID